MRAIYRLLIGPQHWRHMHIEDILSMPDKSVGSSVDLDLGSLKALQMGIPFLRCMGHGISLHPPRRGGPCVCKEAIRYLDSRMVHEA
jgi:hypothetical protein